MSKSNIFFATFVPGLQDLAATVVKERLKDVKIHKLLDGAVLFETETSYDKLNFFCFNNIFAVIDQRAESKEERAKKEKKERGTESEACCESVLENHIRFVLGNIITNNVIANNSKNINSFRIVVSSENVPAAIDNQLRTEAEKYIARLSGLKVNRSLPDTEFWFLYRSEEKQSFSVFMKRLTLRQSWEKSLHKGELPPPVAWTLCRLANVSHTDTVLDPFCGYGSIPKEALKHFHITKFIACDNDKKAASFTASRFKNKEKFTLYIENFESLPSLIGERTVDAIVTDPPWGHFKETNSGFYKKMFDVFSRLLKEGGRAVVLCAKDGISERHFSSFELINSTPILLSGKKAVIYQFIKTPVVPVPSP
jgi:tRNA G10  N-methylase Trm11